MAALQPFNLEGSNKLLPQNILAILGVLRCILVHAGIQRNSHSLMRRGSLSLLVKLLNRKPLASQSIPSKTCGQSTNHNSLKVVLNPVFSRSGIQADTILCLSNLLTNVSFGSLQLFMVHIFGSFLSVLASNKAFIIIS